MRLKEKGFVALLVSGAIMYLFLGVAFIENAKADSDPMTIGYWYAAFNGDSRTDRAYAAYMVANSIMAASYGLAMEDPVRSYDGYDATYVNDRSAQLRACLPEMSVEDTAKFFFGWAERMELRENVWLGAAVSLFMDTCYKAENPQEKS